MGAIKEGKKSIDVVDFEKGVLAEHEYDPFKNISVNSIDVPLPGQKSLSMRSLNMWGLEKYSIGRTRIRSL